MTMTDSAPAPADATTADARPDENKLVAERRAKLAELREQGIAFPNDFRRHDYAGDLQAEYADAEQWSAEALDAKQHRVAVAGALAGLFPPGSAGSAGVSSAATAIRPAARATETGDVGGNGRPGGTDSTTQGEPP